MRSTTAPRTFRVTAALAGLLLLAVAVWTPAAGAAPATPDATAPATTAVSAAAAATAAPDAVTFYLQTLTPAVVTPTDTLTLTGTLTNNTDTDFVDPTLTIGVQQAVPRTREGVDVWFAESGAPTARVEYREPFALSVPAGASMPVTISIPMSQIVFPIRFDNWGARGLEITLATDDARTTVRTTGVFYPSEGVDTPKVRTAVVLPATPTAAEWRDVLQTPTINPTFATSERISALTATGASIALDPAVVGASNARSVVALPWADADVAVLPLAGEDGLDLLAAARSRSTRAFATVPVAATFSIAWPSGGLTADLLTSLRDVGYSGLIVGSGGLELAETPGLTSDARQDLVANEEEALPAVVGDAEFTASILGSALGTQVDPDLAARQRTLAITAVVAREDADPAALAAVVDRSDAAALTSADASALADQVAALAAAPWVDLVDVTTLLDDPAPEAALGPEALTDESAASNALERVARDAVAARDEAAALASSFEDDQPLAAAAERLTLAPSAAWRLADSTGREVTDDVQGQLDRLTSGVTVSPPESQVNLFADSSALPLVVTNNLDVTVTVHIELDPEFPAVRVEDTPDVTLQAGESQTVRVPITAIANGQTPVSVTLVSPDGATFGPPSTFQLLVRAEWEGVTTGIVAAALGVLLVIGLVRSIRRGRRGRDGVPQVPAKASS